MYCDHFRPEDFLSSKAVVVLNLLGFKSRLKTSFETKVSDKEICQLLVAVMFQCMLFSPSKYLKTRHKVNFLSNLG